MSAFIVDDATMQMVVHGISKNARSFGGLDTTECKDLDRIGNALFAMNKRAMVDRYGQRVPCDVSPFSFRPKGQISLVRIYKAIRCFLYQCSEGNVPEERLYIQLNQLALDLAERIVGDLPEYKSAPWG